MGDLPSPQTARERSWLIYSRTNRPGLLRTKGFLRHGTSVPTPETGTVYSNPVLDEECRAGPFLNLMVPALARGSSSWLCQLGSCVLLSPPTQSGASISIPLGMAPSSGYWPWNYRRHQRWFLHTSGHWHFQSLSGSLPDSTVPYASQLPSISPGTHLQSGSAVGLSRLFQSLPVSSWLTLRSRFLRSSCHFCCTSWRWASWARGRSSYCFSESFISAT